MYNEDIATRDEAQDTADDFDDLAEDEVLKTVYKDDPVAQKPEEKKPSSSAPKKSVKSTSIPQNTSKPQPKSNNSPPKKEEKKEVVVVTTREQEKQDRSWAKNTYNSTCSTGNRDICMKSKIRSRCNSRHSGSDKRSARRGCRLLHKQYYKDSK